MSNFQGYVLHPNKLKVMPAQFIDNNDEEDQFSVCFSETECYPLLDVVVVSKQEDGSYHLMLKGYGGTLSSEFEGFLIADEKFTYSGVDLDQACKGFRVALMDFARQERISL